jgi:hypothetical protein
MFSLNHMNPFNHVRHVGHQAQQTVGKVTSRIDSAVSNLRSRIGSNHSTPSTSSIPSTQNSQEDFEDVYVMRSFFPSIGG